MSSIDPDEAAVSTPAGTTARRGATSLPGALFLGVIVWAEAREITITPGGSERFLFRSVDGCEFDACDRFVVCE